MVVDLCLHSQNEVLSKFMEYVNSVEKLTGRYITKLNILSEEDVKVLRSDNGGEYTSNSFAKFCTEKGVSHQFTVPYCPQQNGVAERINRAIMEGARSMLYHAKLPLEFLGRSLQHSSVASQPKPCNSIERSNPI